MSVPRLELPNHEECPVCKNGTLPPIRKDSKATGRKCSICAAIVDREGKIERREDE